MLQFKESLPTSDGIAGFPLTWNILVTIDVLYVSLSSL